MTIDGPVAAGKTSVGRLLAKELQYRFLDTGVMYRAVTWMALELGVALEDEVALGRLAGETDIHLKGSEGDTVVIGGREVSWELRQAPVDRGVSTVASLPAVRVALVERQRELAKAGGIVVVGRDIGTVVLPDAQLKIFLVASPAERASRRCKELKEQGHGADYDRVLKDLESRDELDSGRAHSPLRAAADAHLLDTDGVDLEGVVEAVMELIQRN